MTNPQPRKGVELSGTASAGATAYATLSLTTHLSANHIQSAAFFAREAARIERRAVSQMDDPSQVDEAVRADHRAYVTGAIFAAVAFLEAIVNQVVDAKTLNVPKSMKDGILDKYKYALEKLLPKPISISNLTVYQDADSLILLRNKLVHYEPSLHLAVGQSVPWAQLPRAQRPKLQRLTGMFALNPLYAPKSLYLHRCLGHGCAEWAVQSALAFTDDFFQRLGDAPPYEHVRHRLNTLPPADVG